MSSEFLMETLSQTQFRLFGLFRKDPFRFSGGIRSDLRCLFQCLSKYGSLDKYGIFAINKATSEDLYQTARIRRMI